VYKTDMTAPTAARCVADLRWLVQSPPLLSSTPARFSAVVQAFSEQEKEQIASWLTRLDSDALQRFVAPAVPSKAPMRLGRYAERLMEYFLRESGLFELIAANVPLRSNNTSDKTHTTVGEFDYLLRDVAGQHWHWEMAVKFYLCHPTSTVAVAHDFKGPAGKDTLALKLGKVFNKQLQHVPPAPFDAVNWQPAAYARGWMFYPHGQANTDCDALNPHHLRGWWLGIEAFSAALFERSYFVHLPRLHWLAPYSLNELPIMSQLQAAQHLSDYWLAADTKQADAGQMLACVEQQDDGWREVSRGFVMPRQMPFAAPTN
jgi:uncharacterized protein